MDLSSSTYHLFSVSFRLADDNISKLGSRHISLDTIIWAEDACTNRAA